MEKLKHLSPSEGDFHPSRDQLRGKPIFNAPYPQTAQSSPCSDHFWQP